MGSFNSNILPANTGLTLGNQNQQWTAYLVNAFAGTVQSLSPNQASSGLIRLAASDTVSWRNNANTGDVALGSNGAGGGNVPSDSLTFNGGGLVSAAHISSSLNPSATGAVRLSATDTINFRNTANSADIVGLQHNTDDTITVGGAAGIKQGIFVSTNTPVAASGVVRLAANDQINWRNAANNADEGITVSGSGATEGILLQGFSASTTPTIRLGGSTSAFPMIQRSSTNVLFVLADGSGTACPVQLGNLTINPKIISYNGISTVRNGVASELAVYQTGGAGNNGALSTTTLYAVPASGQGAYRLSWVAKVITAAGVSSTLGPLTVTYTDLDSVVQTITCGAQTNAGAIATTSTGNTTTTILLGLPMLINCLLSSSVTFTFGYASSAANAMAYSLTIILEAM